MYVGRGAGVDSGGVVAGHPYGLGLALGLQLALKSMFAYGLCSPGAFVGRTSWPSARFRTSSTSGGPWGAPKGHPTTDIPFPLPIPLRIYHGISLVAHIPNRPPPPRPAFGRRLCPRLPAVGQPRAERGSRAGGEALRCILGSARGLAAEQARPHPESGGRIITWVTPAGLLT